MQPIRDFEVQAHSAPGCWNISSAGIYFCAPPQENFVYYALVGDVRLWEFYRELMVSFSSSYISEWTLALDTWENTSEAEEEDSPKRSIDSDNNLIDVMFFDAPNL